ncbi:VQ motif-containing protein 9 [Rutidosis leptorrhynchoides]|uniref:VQ motif-containing protein 9 n=1 Tax=Rutidosis leptorrhynchoides TaxID=125765 RepID=UPI003A9A2C50
MEKSCQSSEQQQQQLQSSTSNGGSSSNNNNNSDQYLKQLNKLSHKISKPSTTTNTTLLKNANFDHSQNQNQNIQPPPPPPSSLIQSQPSNLHQPQHHQPPVYNINKNDFRDVVQKLTGSPAHDRFSNPPPIQQPKQHSSRLHRIRPPPLSHVTNRPPPMMGCPPFPQPANNADSVNGMLGAMNPNHSMPSFMTRSSAPLSPLPPFPAVHAAAESPISAYMRCLQSYGFDPNPRQQSFSGFSPLAPLVSPRWNGLAPPPQQHQPPPRTPPNQQFAAVPPGASLSQPPPFQFQPPTSPLPFGCLGSPKMPYPCLSPGAGQSGFPLSPTVAAVPSPKYRGI